MSQKQAKRQKTTNKRVEEDKYLTVEADETVALLGFAPAARREEWRLYCELLMTVLLSVALFAAAEDFRFAHSAVVVNLRLEFQWTWQDHGPRHSL